MRTIQYSKAMVSVVIIFSYLISLLTAPPDAL